MTHPHHSHPQTNKYQQRTRKVGVVVGRSIVVLVSVARAWAAGAKTRAMRKACSGRLPRPLRPQLKLVLDGGQEEAVPGEGLSADSAQEMKCTAGIESRARARVGVLYCPQETSRHAILTVVTRHRVGVSCIVHNRKVDVSCKNCIGIFCGSFSRPTLTRVPKPRS